MRRIHIILFSLLLASCVTSIQSGQRQATSQGEVKYDRQYNLPADIGAAFWSGLDNVTPVDQTLPGGMDLIATKGFQTVKIPIDPFNIDKYFGISNLNFSENSFLNVIVNTPQVKAALGNPKIQNYVLSVYDAIVNGKDGKQRKFTNPVFLNSRKNEIIAAYKEFALALFRNHKDSGKVFVISNWETDNAIYCGEAYSFFINKVVTRPSGESFKFRDNCLSSYQEKYGVPTPQSALDAMALWFSMRQQGISEARTQASAEGIHGVTVRSGIEFNAVRMLHDLGYPSVIFDLFPKHPELFDVLLYSAYESTNLGTLHAEFSTILKQAAGHHVGISEFGFQRETKYRISGQTFTADQMMTRTVSEITELLNNGSLEFAIAWQAFKTDGKIHDRDFGLLNNDGSNTNLMVALLKGLNIDK